jgi:oxygen-independent coproporphyrinogen-3 oxidase
VKHLSAYHLTIEKDTVFDKWLSQEKIREIDEEDSVQQYEYIHQYAHKKGFTHYEVSNYSLNGYHSQHNSLYWSGKYYTGFGASAHSYSEAGRQWNLDTVKHYIGAVEAGKVWYKRELLTDTERYHDYLVTKLRTQEGIMFSDVERLFGRDRVEFIKKKTAPFLTQNLKDVVITNKGIRVTYEGWMRLDTITRALMLD